MKTLYPDDIVVALLHFVKKDKKNCFVADRKRLHTYFLNLKNEYPELLHPFQFKNRGFFPESDVLDQVLANLEASGLLERRNTTPKHYWIQANLDQSYKDYIEKRLSNSKIDTAKLESAADAFIRELSVSDNSC